MLSDNPEADSILREITRIILKFSEFVKHS